MRKAGCDLHVGLSVRVRLDAIGYMLCLRKTGYKGLGKAVVSSLDLFNYISPFRVYRNSKIPELHREILKGFETITVH